MLLLDVEIRAQDEDGNQYIWAMGTHVRVVKPHKLGGYFYEIDLKEKDLKKRIEEFKDKLKEVIK